MTQHTWNNQSPPASTTTRQVYLIEKNSDDIALARRAISRAGYAVHLEALQTADALKHTLTTYNQLTSPDLMLIDLNLDDTNRLGENALALTRWLRKNPTTQHTPIVIISSLGREEEILNCYQSGANSVIHKPVAFTEYASVLKDVCSYWLNISVMPHFDYIKQVNQLISSAHT